MFHSAFAAFGHSKSASATAFPPIVLWRRARAREWQGQAVYHHPLLSPCVSSREAKRWGLGDIGAATQLRRVQLGAPGGTEGHRMELHVWASRILNPLGGWSPLSTPILSLSNSPARSLVLLLSQHLQEKRLDHPLWPALELWCGSQWHRLDSFRARLESLMGELRGQTHRGSRCLCCCAVLLVGSFHSHY